MTQSSVDVASLETLTIDDTVKGVPGGVTGLALSAVGRRGWNVLRGDLPLPLAILKESALAHNSRWMQRFVERTGVKFAPHGKTTMSPQLFDRQLQDGAWAITLATVPQVQVARRYGVSRVFLANQLVGRAETTYVLNELGRDPGFDFYCLVDSEETVALLASATREIDPGRPVQVLVERGFVGGRAGCRTTDEAVAVARAVRRTAPRLVLRGVEGFEGLVDGVDAVDTERRADAFLRSIVETARACEGEGLFAPGEILLTAGGSAFFDLVVDILGGADIGRPVTTVIRAGCYLTHDSEHYQDAFARILARSGAARETGGQFQSAIELWAYVQSRPEATRVILNAGKRDTSHDVALPRPLQWFRPETHVRPLALDAAHVVVALNDQHALLDVPASSPLAVGDRVALGISHPCTTFDKWRLLPVVDDAYNVISAVRTFF